MVTSPGSSVFAGSNRSSATDSREFRSGLVLWYGGYDVLSLNKFVGALDTNSKHSIGLGVSSSGPLKIKRFQ